MRILIADDHSLMRRGLVQLLSEEFPDAAFGEAGDSAQALDRIWRESWDLLILDIQMPGRSGFEVLDEVRKKQPGLLVLILSAYPEDQLGLRTLKAGAAGYVTKQTADPDLISAIRKVMTGGKYISPALAETLAESLSRPSGQAPHESLSYREFQVMQMLADGKAAKEIASDLSLSSKTVATVRRRALDKLGVRSNIELFRYALEHGLVPARNPET